MIYDGAGFDDLPETVRNATADIRPYRNDFDSIVVRGLSGIVVGSAVSLRIRKPLVVVRKDCELEGANSHATGMVENRRRIGARYLWLDDFVSSGETRVQVWSGIAVYADADAKMVLEYHYRDQHLQPAELCNHNGCDAAIKREYQTCDYCEKRTNAEYDVTRCWCRSNQICGLGHWQS